MKDFKDYTRERSDKEVIKRLIKYLKPHKKPFILATIFMFLSLGVQLVPPLLLGVVLNTLADKGISQDEKLRSIIIVSIGFLIVIVLAHVILYFQDMILQKVGQGIVFTLRAKVFDHIENLTIGQINQVPVGKLVTRVANDTNTISEMYTNVAVNLIKNILYLAAILVILFFINVRMTLLLITILPLVVIATMVFRRFSRASYRAVRANVSEVNAFLSENLSGIKVTQIFNQEDKKRREFKDRSRKLRNSYLREIMVFGVYRPTMYLLSMAGIVLILWIGYQDVMNPLVPLTAGLLFSYYLYVQNFFDPILQMAEQFNMLQNGFASAEKIFDVLDTKPEITDDPDAVELESFSGHIEFKNVWFQYIEDEWVLKDVSFEVLPSQTVAFVGATGSGKTTILALIVRNYDIQKGQILIDGIDIRKIKRASLRKHIGQMLQDVFLFSGNIIDNIRLNDDSITKQEVIEACKYVGADTFIERLPDQYDHVVLERGNNFSTGQRQLISFARAITYKPSLMILDEATANIDSETEALIQESMKKMMNISTMLIVAHRLSTIQHSDKIIVMQKGEIKEAGSHQELLKLKKLYYKLYQLQYEEKESEFKD
jgi:ATP-binding cassette, subfamily B, multidrug efflux pump